MFFIVSLLASTIGSISGIGGGILIKPILDAITALDAATIGFLSGCTVLSMSAVSLVRNRKKEARLDVKKAAPLALGAVCGGILGKHIFELLFATIQNKQSVSSIQNAIIAIMCVAILLYQFKKDAIQQKNIHHALACVALGVFLGVLSAFLGIGGGPINVILIGYFFGMDSKTAALHSIYVIFFTQLSALLTSLVTNSIPSFQWQHLLLMILGGISGGAAGSWISSKIRSRHIDRLFCCVLFAVIFVSLFNVISA